jgi:hypothetical protein
MIGARTEAGIVIQAVRSFGKKGVHEIPVHTFAKRVPRSVKAAVKRLTLARGHYCPKEHQQHLELAAFYPKIAVAYTQIATIATDDHHTLQEFRASVGAQWTFLSDPGRTIQQGLDIQEYTDPEHNPMIPHTVVLKPGLGGIPRIEGACAEIEGFSNLVLNGLAPVNRMTLRPTPHSDSGFMFHANDYQRHIVALRSAFSKS